MLFNCARWLIKAKSIIDINIVIDNKLRYPHVVADVVTDAWIEEIMKVFVRL